MYQISVKYFCDIFWESMKNILPSIKHSSHRIMSRIIDGQIHRKYEMEHFPKVGKSWRSIKQSQAEDGCEKFCIISTFMHWTLTTYVFVWFLSSSTLLGDTNSMFSPSTLLVSTSPLSWSGTSATDLLAVSARYWSAFLRHPCQAEWSLLR